MKRREFLISSLATPVILKQMFAAENHSSVNYQPATENTFEFLEVKGSYYSIGHQTGKQFGSHIKKLIERRADWHRNLMVKLGSQAGQKRSAEYVQLTKKHFPHILEEIRGLADGSGLHFNAVWAMCIKSELESLDDEPTGCSTIFHKDREQMWLFHNEDGHAAYCDIMFVLKVIPPSGVNYLSLVYPGIITGNGPSMNSCGIIQATNYIGSTESEIGLPRYVIGRAVLEAKTLDEAFDIVTMEPRAYPYHHNIGHLGEKKYYSLETTPFVFQAEEPQSTSFHTNHLLFDKTRVYKAEDEQYKQTSSLSRYKVIQQELTGISSGTQAPADYLKILSSHFQAPYSPCRHPLDDVKGATLGTAFFDFNQNTMRLFRGNPCEATAYSRFVDFKLDTLG